MDLELTQNRINWNKELKITKELFKEVDNYSIYPQYFYLKGMKYELGINKEKNLKFAIEFYKQGVYLNQFSCCFRLFIIYQNAIQNKIQLEELHIVDDVFLQSLLYLLKSYAYYDYNNFLCIEDWSIFKNSVSLLQENFEKLREYIEKNKNELLISEKEKEYLILFYLEENDKIFEAFKKTSCDDFLYYIIKNLLYLENNFSIVYEIIKQKNFTYQTNLKIFALIFNFISTSALNNNLKFDSNNPFHLLKSYIIDNKSLYKTKLKLGFYLDIYCELKLDEIDYNYKLEETTKLQKILKNFYISLKLGSLKYCDRIFYLNLFLNKKNVLDYSNKSKITENLFDLIYSIYENSEEFKLYNIKLYLKMMRILASFYIKGINIKKNYRKAIDLLKNLNELIKTDVDLHCNNFIFVNYYLAKCYLKIYEIEHFNYYYDEIYKQINILSHNYDKEIIMNYYLISKLLLLNPQKSMEYKDVHLSFQILNKIKFLSNEEYKAFSFTIIDKIYINKSIRVLDSRKEFPSLKINDKVGDLVICKICEINEASIIAIPCYHKVICSKCLSTKNEIVDLNKCYICHTVIDTLITKIFN